MKREPSSEVYARWQQTAAAMTFRKAWPWPMRIVVCLADAIDGFEIRVSLGAPCIVTGEEQRVHMIDHVPFELAMAADEAQIANLIRGVLKRLVVHEFDECLLLDGVQVHDPHAREQAERAA